MPVFHQRNGLDAAAPPRKPEYDVIDTGSLQ